MKKILLLALILSITVGCHQKEEAAVKQEPPAKEVKEVVQPKACTKDAKMCPNGRSVGRDPNNNCEFFECDTIAKKPIKPNNEVMCTADVKECPDGSWVGRDHQNNCQFKPCPETDKNGRDIE